LCRQRFGLPVFWLVFLPVVSLVYEQRLNRLLSKLLVLLERLYLVLSELLLRSQWRLYLVLMGEKRNRQHFHYL
jgi:hypothetical protein